MLDTIQEYDQNDPATWTPMAPPASHEEIERCQKELVHIGELTPNGKPMLMLRWGATYQERGKLKYWLANTEDVCTGYYYQDGEEMVMVPHGQLGAVPPDKIALPMYEHTELGERRWIVEQWRSPEFMHRSGRDSYEATHDNLPEMLCCGYCDTPKETRGLPCRECGSRQEYETKGDGRQLIPDDFNGGHYDFFIRLEGRKMDCEPCEQGVCPDDSHSTYRSVNPQTLQAVANLWNYQQNRTAAEKTADNALMDERITVCNFCLRAIEPSPRCPYCKGISQSMMTPKTLAAQQEIWSPENVARQKDLAEQAARRGPMVTVPSTYNATHTER